jgi:hypothetical protein
MTKLKATIQTGSRMVDLLNNTNPYHMFAMMFWMGATIHPNNRTMALKSFEGIKS